MRINACVRKTDAALVRQMDGTDRKVPNDDERSAMDA